MSLPALYELANEYRSLELLADGDELPAEAIRDTLEALQGDIEMKSANVAKFVLGLEAEAKMIDEAAEAMRKRAELRRRRAENIRNYLLFQLQQVGIMKIECPEFRIAVRKNPEAVEINNPEEVPAEYMVTPPAPPPHTDKAAIKAALKAGAEIPGCWLRQGERLEIKT